MATKWPRTSKSSWPSQVYINQRLREIFGKMATKATNICQVDIYFLIYYFYKQSTNITYLFVSDCYQFEHNKYRNTSIEGVKS